MVSHPSHIARNYKRVSGFTLLVRVDVPMQEIVANINPKYLDHFKSQLIQYEVNGNSIEVLCDGGGHQDRHQLMTSLVKRSFEDFPSTRKLRFWVFTGDNRPTNSVNDCPLFSISGPRINSDFVIPDPYTLMWRQAGVDEFKTYCDTITHMSKFSPIKKSAVWRGLTSQNPVRKFIVDGCNSLKSEVLDLRDTQPDLNGPSFIEMKDLAQWSVFIDMPGHGFSGRLKYLLHAYRPVIVFERLDWDAVTINLEPGIHYVNCPPDFNVLNYRVNEILANYENYVERYNGTVELIRSLTERKNVSLMLVKKVSMYS